MKHFAKLTLLSIVFLAIIAAAQNGPFKHIIIIVQEDRTPDNLFGAGDDLTGANLASTGACNQENPFETGVDIVDGGYGYVYDSNGNPHYQLICNAARPLNGWDASIPGYPHPHSKVADPDHSYGGWGQDFRGYPGSTPMTGFCHEFTDYSIYGGQCPSYSYVKKADVKPYFDIATAYGFANYMFQSDEGPSPSPHQFLFTGTSAPTAPTDTHDKDPNNYYDFEDFLSDLITTQSYGLGCPYNGSQGWPGWVEPDGKHLPTPPLATECYAHDTLVTDAKDCTNPNVGHDYCDRGVPGWPHSGGWAYYVEPRQNPAEEGGTMWDAPASNPEVCYGESSRSAQGMPCGPLKDHPNAEWADHIRIPRTGVYAKSYAPIFDDLFNCNLPAISWVVPDGSWSDHPFGKSTNPNVVAAGPSWVGDIINAVGGGMKHSTCNGPNSGKYWSQEATAIFVVWDDWGGWYDHVTPWIARQQNPHPGYTACDPSTQWGCGYTDGFRVPFLVVSPYTPSYVSGACGTGTPNSCPNFGTNNIYVHDFGSILAYTEWNFGMPFIDGGDKGYADWNAPEWQSGKVPLSDFFPLWTPPNPNPRSFTSITTRYRYQCFQNPYGSHCPSGHTWEPSDPDSY